MVALVAAAGLVGCGGGTGGQPAALATGPIEVAIARSVLTQRGVRAAVRCPPRVTRRKGVRFTCRVALDAGSYPVAVLETNDAGHVRYSNSAPLVVLDMRRVEGAIERSTRHQRGLSASVTCPAEVLQQTGIVFTCVAKAGGRSYPFEVTETDGHGHVRYVGR